MGAGSVRNLNVLSRAFEYFIDFLVNVLIGYTLNKITEKKLPELTDEFVKKHAGVDTVEEYRNKARTRLEKSAENKSRDETENSIISEIPTTASSKPGINEPLPSTRS